MTDERFLVGASVFGGGNKRKSPASDRVSGKTTGDPRIGSPVLLKGPLFTEAQLLEELSVLRKVVLFDVVEEFAAAAGHLEETTAAVKVLTVSAEMLGQVIDAGSQQGDLDLGRAGVFIVSFVFCDDFGFGDGRHGL